MRTNELRKLIRTMLLPICSNVYYRLADEKALYPHIVFEFRRLDLGDLSRQDYTVEIDVWDKNVSNIEDMCDNIERIFNNNNKPQESILPTFFIESRDSIEDEDKTIQHRLIKVSCQNYEV